MRVLFLTLLLALAGCGTWTKPDASAAQSEADENACAVEAAKAHPPQMLSPPELPAAEDRECGRIFGQSQCPPLAGAPRATQTDMNDGARHVAFQRCMTGKGYRFSTK